MRVGAMGGYNAKTHVFSILLFFAFYNALNTVNFLPPTKKAPKNAVNRVIGAFLLMDAS